MDFLISVSARLLERSFKTRLAITLLSLVICCPIYVVSFPPTQNGSILVIPIILTAWLFGYRGLPIVMLAIALFSAAYYSLLFGTVLWPRSILLLYLAGTFSGLAIGLVVSFLRRIVDLLRIAQVQKQEALQSYEQQVQMNQLKDQLILHINHELRTPLTSVQGYLELLKMLGKDADATKQVSYISKALDGCEELALLINKVLDVAHAEREEKELQMEELAVADSVREALARFDPLTLQDSTIQQEIPEDLTVWADRKYLQEVLQNLLSNAFKYTPEHTVIRVSACHLSNSPDEVCIRVKDDGPGIPPAELPLLFQKFVRLQRDSFSAIPGTGLGLYICKRLVEVMKGRIWVESSGYPGEGSNFCFTLPSASPKTLSDSDRPEKVRGTIGVDKAHTRG